jgi:hypothetical protein
MGKKDFVKDADAAMAASGEISDPRFRAAHSDPRFQRFPTHMGKTKIDKRFQRMFNDPNFGTGGPAAGRDKRGRKSVSAKKSTADDLKEYYDLDEDDDDDDDAAGDANAGDKKAKSKMRGGAETEEELRARLEKSRARMRGAAVSSDSDADSDADSDSDADDSSDSDATDEEGEEGVIPRMLQGASGYDDDVPTCDATSRVAIVDQEWQHLRAVDLLVVLRSFCPKNGRVKKVTVYPSDFGLQRMKEEAVRGPLAAFGKTFAEVEAAAANKDTPKKAKPNANAKPKAKVKADDDSELSMESSDESESDEESEEDSDDDKQKEEDPDVARERMRLYERDRMRYYYAVAEFDSVDTAHAVYRECDGLEFERSSCKLDMRYVQDDQRFAGREVRDVASDVPGDYEPPEFQAKALQHTNVKLSWDEDDPARKKAFNRKLTEDKLKDEDFAAYMADSQSDESELDDDDEDDEKDDGKVSRKKGKKSKADAEAEKKKYLALLGLGGGGSNGKSGDDDDDDDDDEDGFMKSASESGDDDDGVSDEDVSDEDEGFKRATWGGSKTSGKNGDRFGNKGSRKKEGDMEVTFHAGLEEFGARMKRKKELGGRTESVWEQEERRRKERRDERKAGKKTDKAAGGSDSDGGDGDDGDASGFSDPFFDGEGADEGDIDWDGMGGESEDEIGEKTAKRGKKSKGSKRSVDADDDDEDRFKLDKESKKQKKRRERGDTDDPDAARERADLELLMMNDDEVRGVHSGAGILGKKSKKQAGGDANEPKKGRKSRKERLAEKRKSRGKAARRQESDDEDDETANGRGSGANVDTSDGRFAGLFESHHFALDPTDPRYKEVKAADVIVKERDRRRRAKDVAPKRKKGDDAEGEGKKAKKGGESKDLELSAMVAGLKRKKVATV